MSDQITQLLGQIDRLDQEAEAGPWDHEREVNTENGWSLGTVRSRRTGESVAPEVYNPDGAFIALARTFAPAAAKALRAVLELHRKEYLTATMTPYCQYCRSADYGIQWPCPTYKAITDAMGDADD